MAVTPEELRFRISAKNDASPVLADVKNDIDSLSTSARKSKKDLNTSTDAVSLMGRKAGMAGIQLQQLFGQIQGGTNPMLALSQQSADLGFVLGAPLLGAVAGLASSLAMVLLPALFDSKEAVDKYEEAMKSARDATELLENGQYSLAEAILETAKISQIAAKLDIAKAVSDYEKALQAAVTATNELAARSGYMGSSLSGEMSGADEATQRLIISLGRVADLQSGKLKTTPKGVQEAYDALRDSVTELGLDYAETAKLALLFNAATSASATPADLLAFSDALGEVALSLKDDSLLDYADRLSNMAVEGTKTKAALDLLKESLVDLPAAIKRSETEKENAASLKSSQELAREQMALEDKVSAEFTARLQDRLRQEDEAKNLLMKQEDEVSDFFTAKLQDRIKQEDEEYELKRTRFDAWRDDYESNMMQMGDIAISTAQTFQSSFGQALEDVFMGTKSVEDAFNDMARTILGQVINSLGQMAAQWITNQILAQTLGATATATSVAQAAALSAAWATPAALASLASFGTNAAPAAASIAGTVAFSKTMASFEGGGYTGDGARSGGLDGKGGFMAMVHPNETIVDHTKGQSAESVTVVQNISVTTGVQQTVRNEIASMMPQIAEASKQAVLEARKRGGSFSAAFGG